ncbi:MAG: carbon-nitrogen hydrolase family protein [Thermomicrobiales bacterium]
MTELTIALLQMTARDGDQAANLTKGEAFCRRARALGADVALFPEMWSVGYTSAIPCPPDAPDLWRAPGRWATNGSEPAFPHLADVWKGLAIGRDDPFVLHFRNLARELEMAIALTYLERWDGLPRNAMSLIDRHGEIVFTYAKVHTCDFSWHEAALTPGDDFYVGTLDTAKGDVQIGAMICYDREFPESARILMLKGAEIILTPNACDLEANRIGQFRARACENMVGVAMTNYAGPGLGHSVAFDPIGFDDKGCSRNSLLVEAGENEDVYLARFDLDTLRDYRRRETWGNAFRRPHLYGRLTSLAVAEPFLRVDAAGERYDPTRRTAGRHGS